ncbi:MAG: hypothetical protein K0R08_1816, partial [Solimicrobium sp.]|nr:hypothetical protein [Solimicrobium sp.]
FPLDRSYIVAWSRSGLRKSGFKQPISLGGLQTEVGPDKGTHNNSGPGLTDND